MLSGPSSALSPQLEGTARAWEGGAQGAASSTRWIPFFLLLVACIWAACAFQRGSLLAGSALLPPTSTVQFAPFVLNIYTMKAEVRNSHHRFTAEAGTLEKSNNKTENRIFKMTSTAMKPGEESLGTSASSLLAHPCCQGGAEAAPGSQDPV